MLAKTPKAAVDAYADLLREVVNCVTERLLVATGFRVSDEPHQISFMPRDEPARLRTGGRLARIGLTVSEQYVVESDGGRAPFAVRRVGYWYEVLDADGREILGYHWHPTGLSSVASPHLHLTGRIGPLQIAGGGAVALGEMHLPTGPVTLADVVRLLIAEFGVEPRRSDWRAILTNS